MDKSIPWVLEDFRFLELKNGLSVGVRLTCVGWALATQWLPLICEEGARSLIDLCPAMNI
jgi:hypothetical protein